VTGVVAPIGCDVGESGAEKTGHDQGQRELAEGFDAEVNLRESSPSVEVADVGRDRETEAVGVKDQRTEVKRSRDPGHG